jgi:hypothetical protein
LRHSSMRTRHSGLGGTSSGNSQPKRPVPNLRTDLAPAAGIRNCSLAIEVLSECWCRGAEVNNLRLGITWSAWRGSRKRYVDTRCRRANHSLSDPTVSRTRHWHECQHLAPSFCSKAGHHT